MLRPIKARPMILVAAGLLWTASVAIAVRAGVPPLAGDFAQGLGMGVGIGLEVLGLILLGRQKRRRDALAGTARRF